MRNTSTTIRYSEAFKRMVVEEIERGVMSVPEATRYYGITGGATIYRWISVYGMEEAKGRKVIIMSKLEETELITLRRELALLKKQLEEAELRAIAWKSMVDAIEIDLGIPVKKKPLSQALLDARKQLYPEEYDSVPTDTAKPSELPSKPFINADQPPRRK